MIVRQLKTLEAKREIKKDTQVIDMTGRNIGLLTVVGRIGRTRYNRQITWECKCECGATTIVCGSSLRRGDTLSCGRGKHKIKHGLVGTSEYRLWEGAKCRAKKRGVVFTIEISDIAIPNVCPVLGIPLIKGVGKPGDNSATVDRINNKHGYTKENIQIISHKANSIKRNASVEELQLVIQYMKDNGAGIALES